MACCGRKNKKVGNLEAGKNLVLSLANAIRHAVKTGKLSASDEVIENRITTCRACNDLRGNRCLSCGCFVVLKTAIASEKCPKAYWE